jgi:glycosyltransferase involved in cell wall biosynthesis
MIEKIVISRADKIIAVSRFTKETLVSSYYVRPSKIDVVPHGINSNEYFLSKNEILKFKRSIGLDDSVAFLFVGRLADPRKNLLLLLRAFKIMCKDFGKSAKLVLVGAGGPLKIKEIVNSLSVKENIILLGYVESDVLKKCYAACDVVVSPSLLEGFGLVLLEAMASGKPIVALDRGAISELVRDGVNGLLVKKQDPHELAVAMTFFVDHPDVIAEIGEKNREYASQNFSWEKSAELTVDVYETCLQL